MCARLVIKLPLLCCLVAMSCRRDRDSTGDSDTARADVRVTWAAGARCGNDEINDFVAHALAVCARGDYDEYRLLWSYDHQPTNRKRFEQIRNAMERVEIRQVRRLRLRLPDGSIKAETQPVYVLHAFVGMSHAAKQRSEYRIEDRDLILQIVYQNDAWRFAPAQQEVKEAILGALASTEASARPSQPAAGQSDPGPGND